MTDLKHTLQKNILNKKSGRLREVEPGRWQRIPAEIEYESRNFLVHQHDPERCAMIICWVHNWPDCPEHIEVVELSREMGRIAKIASDI